MATKLSALAGIYAQAIQAGNRTIDSVPAVIKGQVTAILNTVDDGSDKE